VVHLSGNYSVLSLSVVLTLIQTALILFVRWILQFDFTYTTVANNLHDNTMLCFLVTIFLLATIPYHSVSGRGQIATTKTYLLKKNLYGEMLNC
jgi:hypothetical protein